MYADCRKDGSTFWATVSNGATRKRQCPSSTLKRTLPSSHLTIYALARRLCAASFRSSKHSMKARTWRCLDGVWRHQCVGGSRLGDDARRLIDDCRGATGVAQQKHRNSGTRLDSAE